MLLTRRHTLTCGVGDALLLPSTGQRWRFFGESFRAQDVTLPACKGPFDTRSMTVRSVRAAHGRVTFPLVSARVAERQTRRT